MRYTPGGWGALSYPNFYRVFTLQGLLSLPLEHVNEFLETSGREGLSHVDEPDGDVHEVPRGWLLHPIKCEADPDLGARALNYNGVISEPTLKRMFGRIDADSRSELERVLAKLAGAPVGQGARRRAVVAGKPEGTAGCADASPAAIRALAIRRNYPPGATCKAGKDSGLCEDDPEVADLCKKTCSRCNPWPPVDELVKASPAARRRWARYIKHVALRSYTAPDMP